MATRRGAFIWPALLSILFTALLLRWSLDRYRLAGPPFLDDVTWMNGGLRMLDALRDGGLPGLIRYVAESQTLDPYSLVAAAGFALFGVVDWAPYVMNVWLIFCFLGFVEILRRRADLPLWIWFPAAGLALSFPIAGYSVVSFIGDHSAGLFTALGAVAFIEGWPARDSRLESWAGTAAWICAFYTKATLFPETLLVFVLSAVLGGAITWRETAERQRLL